MADDVTQISIPNLPSWVKNALEAEANRQDRSLASYLRNILREEAERVGLPTPAVPENQIPPIAAPVAAPVAA